jgi:DNA polymerase-3 subunit alpha
LDFIPEYIACMHGEKEIQYRHPMLEPILKDTYGVHVYQEQIMATAIQLGGYTPGEADILRKIVAKKKVKQLPGQRKKFINGAAENGIEKSVAEAIFNDWEAFANYGFNKGHAAAYALLVMQTAYMKCYYPEEYMSALLSVYIDDKEKVAFYIGDCRKLGIELLPPNVLSSEWGFTIEDIEDENADNGVRQGIRFGLGAIKNVGRNSVEEIMEARQKNSIDTLNDFTKNVNLKKVGKRALEYLTKAGALEHYGPRRSVLAKIEEMASISSSYWQAKESGQMMLFGADTGLEAHISLPDTSAQYNQREELDWEKELIGLYVSDHPVAAVLGDLKNVISHDSSTVHLAHDNSKVIVAGIINSVRYITTKNMKEMAFINIEDVNGILKLVFFPNVWKKFKDEVDYNKIVLIYGQVQSRNDEINIIVDRMVDKVRYFEMSDVEKHQFSTTQPAYGQQNSTYQRPVRENAAPQEQYSRKSEEKKTADVVVKSEPKQAEVARNEVMQPSQKTEQKKNASIKNSTTLKKVEKTVTPIPDMPPEPDAFPDQWMDDAEYYFDDANDGLDSENDLRAPAANPTEMTALASNSIEKLDLPAADIVESIQEDSSSESMDVAVEQNIEITPTPVTNEIKESKASYAVKADVNMQTSKPEINSSASYMLNATFDHSIVEENKKLQKMLRVILRPRGDKSRDFLHIRRIYNILSEYPGNDRFCFYIIEDDKGYLVEYPHIAISANTELMQRLEAILGKENVKIEEINIQ